MERSINRLDCMAMDVMDNKPGTGKSKPGDEMHTLVDRMLGFIQEHGKTTVAEISDVFAVSHEQVEKLSTVLEESGLISMRYALLHPGRTELVATHPQGKAPAKTPKVGKTTEMPMQDYELRELMRGVDLELQNVQQQLNTIERDVMNKLVRIESTLSQIERKEQTANPADIDFLLKEAETLDMTRRDMSARLKIFEKRLVSTGKRIRAVKHAVRVGPMHKFVAAITSPFKRRKKK